VELVELDVELGIIAKGHIGTKKGQKCGTSGTRTPTPSIIPPAIDWEKW